MHWFNVYCNDCDKKEPLTCYQKETGIYKIKEVNEFKDGRLMLMISVYNFCSRKHHPILKVKKQKNQ